MSGPATTRLTSSGREVELLHLAGVPRSVATRVVGQIQSAERLDEGALLLVVLRATRQGIDPVIAAEQLAAGERLPVDPSAYELRAVAGEVGDLLADVDDDAVSAAIGRLRDEQATVATHEVHLDPVGLTSAN